MSTTMPSPISGAQHGQTDRAKAVAVLTELGRFFRLQPDDLRSRIADYASEIAGIPGDRLFAAVQFCKRNCRFFPSLAEILDAAKPGPYDTHEKKPLNGRLVDGEYQPWSGCQCHACRNKTPRDGFYRAPEAFAQQAEYERERDDAFWQREDARIPAIQRGEKFEDYKQRIRTAND